MEIVCSVKEAYKLMEHMDENDMVILLVINRKTYVHDIPRKIERKNGEELIRKADNILYQNNDFFWNFIIVWSIKREKYYSQHFISTIGIKHKQTFYNNNYQHTRKTHPNIQTVLEHL